MDIYCEMDEGRQSISNVSVSTVGVEYVVWDGYV